MARKSRSSKKANQGLENFGKEIERLGKRIEKKGDEWDSWFHRTFWIIGPLVSSIIGLLLLALIIWLLGYVTETTGIVIFSKIGAFLRANMGLLFFMLIFFSYKSYLSRYCTKSYLPLSPIFTAIGVTITLWVMINIIAVANLSLEIAIIYSILYYIETNLYFIFWFVLFIGYIVLLLRLYFEKPVKIRSVVMKRDMNKRLYRSGRNKILGGVCGGIAEYLKIDPVIIRLLWVVAALTWGSGVLAYIIAWIIIPRNPRHKWD